MLQTNARTERKSQFVMNEQMDDGFINDLLCDSTIELTTFEKEERARMEELRQDFLTKSEGFNREYAARVYVALQDVELELHAIRNAYFSAVRFPRYLSCEHPTRNHQDSLELARMVEILTGEVVKSAHEVIDSYTAYRIQAEVENTVMRHLEANVLTA